MKVENPLNPKEVANLSLIDALPVPVIIINTRHRIIHTNPAFTLLTGLDCKSIVNKAVFDYAPFNTEELKLFLENLTKKHKSFVTEVQLLNELKNSSIHAQCQAIIYEDRGSEDSLFLIVLQDVTSFIEKEKSIQDNVQLFKNLSETANDAILKIDDKGRVSYWNSAATKMFGYTFEEARDKDLHKLIMPGKYKDQMKKGFTKFLETGEGPVLGKTINIDAKRKNGSEFPIELTISKINQNGKWHASGIIRDVSQNRKDKESLKYFNTLFKESLNEIYIFDAETFKFLKVNNASCKNLGFSTDELLKLTPIDIDPSINEDLFRKRLTPLIKGNSKRIIYNTQYQRKDGTFYDVEVHIQYSEFDVHKVFTAVVLDITERREAELAQHIIFRIISAGLKTTSLSSIYAIIQFELGQLMDTTNFFIGIYNPENDTISFPYMDDENDLFKNVAAKNTISSFVIKNNQSLLLCGEEVEQFIKKNKIKRVATPSKSWLGVPLLINNKTIGLIVVQSYKESCAFTDKHKELIEFIADQIASIIMKERIELKLQKLNKENEQLLASLPSILIVMDENEQIIRWNRAAEKSFGIQHEDILDKRLLETGISWNWSAITDGIARCRIQNKTITLHDINYDTPAQKNGFLNVIISPFMKENKKYPGFLIICQDITERKILESQLSQAQKLESIGQLAAGIAHEINTPTQFVGDNTSFLRDAFSDLNTLVCKFQALKESVSKDKNTENIIREIDTLTEDIDLSYLLEEVPLAIEQSLEGIARVSKIVRAMKEFSHPGAKEKTAIDINKAIENTITVCRNEWKYVSDIETDFDDSLPPVAIIPDAFNQVILNLIINAAHAISDSLIQNKETKGRILVSTELDKNEVEIRVKDSGTGIPEDIRSKIFDPFFTTKEVGKGTGQGLAISHDVITKKHNGSLKFDTEPNEGTTFIIRLPLN
jgi:PAS domain S-box-containing protein